MFQGFCRFWICGCLPSLSAFGGPSRARDSQRSIWDGQLARMDPGSGLGADFERSLVRIDRFERQKNSTRDILVRQQPIPRANTKSPKQQEDGRRGREKRHGEELRGGQEARGTASSLGPSLKSKRLARMEVRSPEVPTTSPGPVFRPESFLAVPGAR